MTDLIVYLRALKEERQHQMERAQGAWDRAVESRTGSS